MTDAPISIAKTREEQALWAVLERVSDPEIPVLSVVDLGIIRGLTVTPNAESGGNDVVVTITPTYSGCPAMDVIAFEILTALRRNGYPTARVETVLSPAWTTDWLSEKGREKLAAYGIAPPVGVAARLAALRGEAPDVPCPHCGSHATEVVSAFGSTPCKALYRCTACREPFDYFKCH